MFQTSDVSLGFMLNGYAKGTKADQNFAVTFPAD